MASPPAFSLCLLRAAACLVACCVVVSLSTGCSVHYYSPSTGTEHAWGFGHMEMKRNAGVEEEGVRAVVTGMEIYGIGARVGAGRKYLILGWLRDHELTAISGHGSIRFEGTRHGLFNMRVGTKPPWETGKGGEKKEEERGKDEEK